MTKAVLVVSLLLGIIVIAGCNVQASGPQQFPTVPVFGRDIVMEPGVYSCPTSIHSGTHIHGHGAIVTPEYLSDRFAPLSAHTAPGVVRIVCNADLKLSNVSDVDISGVVFDFQNNGGLVLDGVNESRFEIGIVNSTTGLDVQANAGNNAGNVFPRLVIYKTGIGAILHGFNSKAVTWNDFGHVEIVHATNMGIDISQYADTNTFQAVRMHLDPSAVAGVVFNDNNVLGDVDASGNFFGALSCDAEGANTYCADFRGYTVGNSIRMGFGIMPDANKLHFANSFSQLSNIVMKVQEGPKVP